MTDDTPEQNGQPEEVRAVAALKAGLAAVEVEREAAILCALGALAVVFGSLQIRIFGHLTTCRDSLPQNPSAEEFCALVKLIGNLTINFDQTRIDVSFIDGKKLNAWLKIRKCREYLRCVIVLCGSSSKQLLMDFRVEMSA